jgi:hypothetical protein
MFWIRGRIKDRGSGTPSGPAVQRGTKRMRENDLNEANVAILNAKKSRTVYYTFCRGGIRKWRVDLLDEAKSKFISLKEKQ